jgi:flagellar biogenesis protein FliO
MLDSLFGGQLGTTAKFAIAFILVLGLIGIAALIIRRFGAGGMPSSGGGRGRQPRLAVLDSAVVDAKRRLVLIRRDNSEHLLLIGGPSDVVVETNIVRTSGPAPMPMPQSQPERQAERQPERRPARDQRGAPQAQEPEFETPLVPEPAYEEPAAPTPPPAPRPQPAAYSPPPPLPPRAVAHPSAATPAPQPAPTPQVAPQPAPQPASQGKLDPQYADMAQRLEAALRKPATAPAPKAPEATRPMPQAAQPRPAPMPQTRPMPASPAPAVAQPAPRPGPAPAGQPNPFDSLEAEMASLLGQDKKR